MTTMSEPVCPFSPWPGLLCGRGVIFRAVCEYFGGGVMSIRRACGCLFSFLNYTHLPISLHNFYPMPISLHNFYPTLHLPSCLPPLQAPFAPVITDFGSIYCMSDTLKCLIHPSVNLYDNPMRVGSLSTF